MAHHQFHNESTLRVPSTVADPLPSGINTALYGALLTLELLRAHEGIEHFAVVTHRDPDADAFAGLLGMRTLLRELCPNASISLHYDLSRCGAKESTKARMFGAQSIECLAHKFLDPRAREVTAIILVDQPSILSGAVLPPQATEIPRVSWDADVIIDHHGPRYSKGGIVIEPAAGSTSALILRLLQIATQSELISNAWTRDTQLLSHLVCGAEIDAGISQNAHEQNLDPIHNPVVDWVRDCARCSTSHEQAVHQLRSRFDVSAFSEELRTHARRYGRTLGSFALEHTIFQCHVAYAGVASDKAHLADCANKLVREMKRSGAEPTILIVLAALQDSGGRRERSLRAGEPLQVAVRSTHEGLPVRVVAKLLSHAGGGGPSMGAASLNVPPTLENTKSPMVFLDEACAMVLNRLFNQGGRWEGQRDSLRAFLPSNTNTG